MLPHAALSIIYSYFYQSNYGQTAVSEIFTSFKFTCYHTSLISSLSKWLFKNQFISHAGSMVREQQAYLKRLSALWCFRSHTPSFITVRAQQGTHLVCLLSKVEQLQKASCLIVCFRSESLKVRQFYQWSLMVWQTAQQCGGNTGWQWCPLPSISVSVYF